ncbi:carbohydrate binding domain-containing protein [Bacillus cereus]|uniref:phage head spike fiber domain-containing protein n=1 Tax=Bacillus cereus TaxID=1396 RepID=UPI00296F82F2|nr:carbohydrate binding domain-containing protein [Bacillus cereus]MDW4536178.1 carbohydrate binding domain-containing protein [Bacillus cereus]
MEVLATGHISLVDINDAIVSDVPPADPSLGALWIDTTKDPNTLSSWDGTNWVEQSLSISSLDPSFYRDVEKLKDFADKAGSDGIISSGEKANIKLILMEITGDVLSGQTLPTLETIDKAKGGQVYLARAEARASGIPITHADYTVFETAYIDLKTYLESLTPRPWLTGDTTIDPVTWTAKWDAYYEKLSRLAVATSTYLANSIRPGEDYNGVTINTDKGIVVLRGDGLFRTILNATEGISIEKNNAGTWNKMFYTNLDGKIYANGLVISSDSKIAGTDASTIKDNAAAGKAGIDDLTNDLKVTPSEKTTLSREWEAIKAEYAQVLAQATALGVTTSTYTTSYTNLDGVTPKIAAEVLATMTTTYTFASASARDAFRTKISSYFAESEKIKKAINDAINKSASDANSKITNLQIGGRNLIIENSDIRTLPPRNNGDAADNYNYERIYVDMELNKEYTVSAKVEFTTQAPDTDTHISIYPYPEGSDTFVPIIDGKVVFTFTKKSANTNSVLMYAGKAGSTRSKGVIFREIQIEQGNKATAYRLAPEAVDKMINSISFGVRNLIDNSQLFGMQSNHATNYPIDVTETLEGNTKFLRVKNSKKGTDTVTFSVYNSIRFTDIPENLAGKEITVSHKVRASKNVDMTLMALVFKTTGTPDFKFLDYGKIYNITTEWQTVYSTVTLPSDLSQYGGIRYIISSPTTPQPDLYVDYREWKLEYGNRATDWTPSTGDIDKLITDVDKKAEASKSAIADMTSDMKITSLEKSQLSRDWEAIKAEYPQVLALAQSAGVSTSAYTTAYTNLDGTSPKIASEILAKMSTTYSFASAAARDLFKTQMNVYFSESEKIKKAISDVINNSANTANDKIDNLKVGGQNIVRKKQIVPINAASSSFDDSTNTWTLTINDGAGGTWGAGVRITEKFSVIPIGSWYTVSFDVYSPVDITWNNDTNNFPVGTTSGTNDNDEVALRKNSGRNIKANTWTKCWFSYKNKDSSTTELYDQSNIGIVNNTGAPLTFKIRNVKGELGSVATDFSLSQADIDDSIAKVQDNLDKLSVGGKNLLLESNTDYSTTDYLIKMYNLSEDWIVGQEYTFVIKGTVPAGQKFGIWMNGGSDIIGHITTTYVSGVTYLTFKAIAPKTGHVRTLSLYNYPQNTTLSTVDWVALYKGNKPMDWSPAPEDIENTILGQLNSGNNLLRNSGDFRNLNGWVLNGGTSLNIVQKDGFSVLEAVGSIASTNTVNVPVIKAGTEYVYTTEIMFSEDTTIASTTPMHFWFFDTGGNNNAIERNALISSETVAKANTWTRISILFKTKPTISSAAYFKVFIYGAQLTATNKYWVKNVMFSEANRIVNWSPSTLDVSDMITDIQVGGNNIIPNSLFKTMGKWRGFGTAGGTKTAGVDVDLAGFGTGFQFESVVNGEYGLALDSVKVTIGETYTLSAWFKLTKTGVIKMQEGNSNVKWTYTKSQPEVGKWVRVVHTFVAKDSTLSVYAGADSSSVATAGFVTGFQLERGNKVTDWSLATQDINDLIDAANKRYDDMKIGGTQMLTGTDFKDASGWSRWGNIGSVGHYVQTQLPTGKALFMETRNGTTQLPVPLDTKIGMASDGRKFAVKSGREYTLSMNVATSELGDLLDYMYLMYTVEGGNRRLGDIKTTDFPKFAPIATGSATNYYSVKLTFKADRDDDNAYILIGGSTKREMTGSNGYAWIRVNSLKIEEGNVATSWELAPADIDKAISDTDKKAQDAANNANNALKQGQVVVNSTFSNWTQAFPAGLGSWTSSSVSKETTLTRTGSAMRFDVPTDTAQIGAQITTGYFIPNLPNNKYYVVELDFMLVSGSITGACVLLDWNGMSPSRASIHLSDVVSAPTLGKWYTVRAVMKRPTDNLSGYSAMAGYLLANYSGSTTNKVKNIVFDRLVFREPTQQEIDAYEITTIENGVTVIDGGKLKTNSVKAESVDARRLRVTNNSGTVTLEITNTGEVTVNGTVYINSSSMFADGYDPSKTDGGRNIVLNSRFSTADATSWTTWGSPSVKQVEDITDLPGFDKAVKFTTTGANQGLYQTLSVESGKKYTASCYVKSSSGQGIIQVNDGASGYPGATMDPGDAGKNKWVKLYFTFTAKGNTAQVYIGRSGGGTNGTYWFTGVKLEEGSKLTAWNPANEDIDGLIGKVVTPNGDIKALDIASSMSVTPGAIDVVSKNINLKGKVTFSDFASGWALDSKGNKISNSDQPGYDPAKPLYLDMDGNYRPLSDEKNFMSNLFTKDDTNGVTVIDGNYIKTGTIQAKYANFRDVQVYNDSGQQTFHIDTNGNLSTSGTSQSIGYERQKKGWKIDADGSAEFNAATFRGDIELGYYNAPTDSFIVTGGLLSSIGGTGKDLRFWAGPNKSTAPFKVFSDGTLEATKGYFTGTFSGEVVVGNISIQDSNLIKGDAKIILTDDSKIQKVVLGESAVELNTKTTFGNFLTIDITNQKLDFGANDFGIDYKNNTIRMKSFSLKGTTALEFVSDGSSGDDFIFKNVTGDTSVRVDGSFIARDDIEITNVLRMKKSTDSGNKGIDYVFI